jgi:hypothetical protein
MFVVFFFDTSKKETSSFLHVNVQSFAKSHLIYVLILTSSTL